VRWRRGCDLDGGPTGCGGRCHKVAGGGLCIDALTLWFGIDFGYHKEWTWEKNSKAFIPADISRREDWKSGMDNWRLILMYLLDSIHGITLCILYVYI
jgi:hypothetical protein